MHVWIVFFIVLLVIFLFLRILECLCACYDDF